jgi:hypothetical protein
MSNSLERDKGWRQSIFGGNSDVAGLEHGTSLVELYHAGGVAICGLIRFVLHQSWSYQLESFSLIP